jgi:hypothetical protein
LATGGGEDVDGLASLESERPFHIAAHGARNVRANAGAILLDFGFHTRGGILGGNFHGVSAPGFLCRWNDDAKLVGIVRHDFAGGRE